MTLRLADHWLWDFWLAEDGEDVHLFHLQAPRSLGDPDLRHVHATIGHAVSRDLRSWRVLPAALGPGEPGAFDDLATWTGSVVRAGDAWLMAYSGVARADHARVQRIGLARSADLVAWARCGPVIEADPRWYECGPDAQETHWRDPWAWWAVDGTLHLFITARANRGPRDGRGVIGHAWSVDGGRTFEVGPPLSDPGELRQIEVPQLLHLGRDRWGVLASAQPQDHAAVRRARPGFVAEGGALVLEGRSPLGPFAVPPGRFLLGDPAGRYYAARMIERRDGLWLLAWEATRGGAFVGELSDPIPVETGPDGRLQLPTDQSHGTEAIA